MKKVFLAFLVLFLAIGTAYADEPPFFYDEGIIFGKTMEYTLDNSIEQFHKGSKTELICNTTILDVETTIALDYGKSNTLFDIKCQLNTDGLKGKYCLSDYNEISEYLTSRFRDPHGSFYGWKSKKAADKYGENYAEAIDAGVLIPIPYWDFTDVFIAHSLTKSGNTFNHFIHYFSPALSPDYNEYRNMYMR